jgi:hypothetical protein
MDVSLPYVTINRTLKPNAFPDKQFEPCPAIFTLQNSE